MVWSNAKRIESKKDETLHIDIPFLLVSRINSNT